MLLVLWAKKSRGIWGLLPVPRVSFYLLCRCELIIWTMHLRSVIWNKPGILSGDHLFGTEALLSGTVNLLITLGKNVPILFLQNHLPALFTQVVPQTAVGNQFSGFGTEILGIVGLK